MDSNLQFVRYVVQSNQSERLAIRVSVRINMMMILRGRHHVNQKTLLLVKFSESADSFRSDSLGD